MNTIRAAAYIEFDVVSVGRREAGGGARAVALGRVEDEVEGEEVVAHVGQKEA